ncbi:MAG: amino acid permease, partial [Acidobacteria bacterium]|nr:amino acid permease [Acidobacteriota bacterium]
RTPHVTTIVTGLLVGGVAGIANIEEMVDLTNIGTLFAFVLVCIAIPVLRRRDPERVRPFRVPGGPYLVPLLGAAACILLMAYLPPASWWRFVGWLTLGLAVYCAWGFLHSKLRAAPRSAAAPLDVAALGFLAAAIGMFVMPHDAGFAGVFARAAEGGRAGWGVGLLAAGLAVAVAGIAVARGRMQHEERG